MTHQTGRLEPPCPTGGSHPGMFLGSDSTTDATRAIAFGLIPMRTKTMSTIDIGIEIELPSAICIDVDFDGDVDLDYPKYGITILER